MITLRVDEKALGTVVRLAMLTEDQTPAERAAISHVGDRAAQGLVDKIEQQLEIDIPEIYGVPI